MLVETARDMIYMDGVRPGADAISNLLASRAVVPTQVSTSVKLQIPATSLILSSAECIFRTSFKIWI